MPLESLDYAPTESAGQRHNRIYTVLLIAMAGFFGLGIISMASFSRNPTLAPEARWIFQMTVWTYIALDAAIVVTLILRGTAPRGGRIATKSLNILLLVVFPLGTALGIYGLRKVDKTDSQ